jgi:dTDP-4-amino-4,6-dideoxygalactose transaminase
MAAAFEWGLQEQRLRLGAAIDNAILRVLDHGEYVLGPEVARLEHALAEFTGARHCFTCGNGTNGLLLALMALDIGPGDIVFVPAFSFVASAEPIALLGATPFFVDVLPESFNIDPVSLQSAVSKAKQDGLRARAVIAVDLFGQPADYAALRCITDAENLLLISDFCQSMGAQFKGRKAGVFGDISVTSFFPTKPLGCYGDGGFYRRRRFGAAAGEHPRSRSGRPPL